MRKVINEAAFVVWMVAILAGVVCLAAMAVGVEARLHLAACAVVGLAAYTVGFFTVPDPNEVDR